MDPITRQLANTVAQQNLHDCARIQGLSPSSPAVADQGVMLGRFWLEGRVGWNTLDRAIVERAKRDDVSRDMKRLGECLEPRAAQAGVGELYRGGMQAYDLARSLALRAERSPAVQQQLEGMLPR
jgi:hypothetical protein